MLGVKLPAILSYIARASASCPSWHIIRAFIIVSIASLNLSEETALVFSRSSISMRICKSRAAHPRVNEPAVVRLIMAPRHSVATATWTEQVSKCFVTAELLELVGAAIDVTLSGRIIGVDWPVWEKRPTPLGWPRLLLS
jgi:hypothetical protein